MEPWFAALARPTAAVPSAAAHNNALAWRTSPSRRGVRTSKPLQLNPLPTRHLQCPSRSHQPTHPTTDHYLSDTPLDTDYKSVVTLPDGRVVGLRRCLRVERDGCVPQDPPVCVAAVRKSQLYDGANSGPPSLHGASIPRATQRPHMPRVVRSCRDAVNLTDGRSGPNGLAGQ
jgi:hypothetical protein